MNEEEKKAIELLEDIKNNSWTTKYIMSSDSKNAELLLNLIEKLQKENKELQTQIPNVKNGTYIGDYQGLLKLEKEIVERENIIEQLRVKVNSLKEENENLKADNYELNNRITDLLENIPIQKIKDKIKELKKKVEELTDEKGYWGGSDLLEQIKVLQQLLEKEQ